MQVSTFTVFSLQSLLKSNADGFQYVGIVSNLGGLNTTGKSSFPDIFPKWESQLDSLIKKFDL